MAVSAWAIIELYSQPHSCSQSSDSFMLGSLTWPCRIKVSGPALISKPPCRSRTATSMNSARLSRRSGCLSPQALHGRIYTGCLCDTQNYYGREDRCQVVGSDLASKTSSANANDGALARTPKETIGMGVGSRHEYLCWRSAYDSESTSRQLRRKVLRF